MKKNISRLVTVILLLYSCAAYAWDGSEIGYISRIDVTAGTNYGFRVYLEGHPQLCSGGDNWAYLNETDSNFKVYVSTLLAAKAQRAQVKLFTNNVSPTRCHIGYISVF